MKVCPNCQRTYDDDAAFCPRDGAQLIAQTDQLIGQVLDGQYEIEAFIAAGRTGKVYRARHVILGNVIAVKVFHPELSRDAAWLHRFQREGQAARRFRHPNAVVVYDLRVNPGGFTYMVMEYVEGRTLDQELQRPGLFRPNHALEVLEPIAHALAAAHALGIVYRTLRPAHVLVGEQIKLLPPEFAAPLPAEQIERPPTALPGLTEGVQAEHYYMAPEVWTARADGAAQDVDGRADVYSLALICYELLTKKKLFDGRRPAELRARHLRGLRRDEIVAALPPAASMAGVVLIEPAVKTERSARPDMQAFIGLMRVGLGQPAETKVRSAGAAPSSVAATDNATAPLAAAEPKTARPPLYADENVQFTVYRPEVIAPVRWYKLLAFAHLSERRADAAPDEPDPVEQVKRIAGRVLADEPARYEPLRQDSLHAVPHKGEITFVPVVEGCEFNPPSQSFFWQQSVHKVEFDLRAAATLEGRTARGRLTVFLGSLILADVPLALRVDSARSNHAQAQPTVPASATPYRKIFASYSHRDVEVVEQITHHIQVLGDKYLRDVTELRAGQDWQRWMRDAIKDADVFQLFWSHNAMRSAYVQQEWEYALALERANFVRPVYWETPLPESPAENLPPDNLRRLHFQHLRPAATTHPAAVDTAPPVVTGELGRAPSADQPDKQTTKKLPPSPVAQCPKCGALNPTGTTFCLTCGAVIKQRPDADDAPAARASASVSRSLPTQRGAAPSDWRTLPTQAGAFPPPAAYYPPAGQMMPVASDTAKGSGLSVRVLLALLGLFIILVLLFVVYFIMR